MEEIHAVTDHGNDFHESDFQKYFEMPSLKSLTIEVANIRRIPSFDLTKIDTSFERKVTFLWCDYAIEQKEIATAMPSFVKCEFIDEIDPRWPVSHLKRPYVSVKQHEESE